MWHPCYGFMTHPVEKNKILLSSAGIFVFIVKYITNKISYFQNISLSLIEVFIEYALIICNFQDNEYI